MPDNLYEVIATRDAQLVKFLDEMVEFSRCVKKQVGLLAAVAEARRIPADKFRFEVFVPPGDDCLVVRIKGPNDP